MSYINKIQSLLKRNLTDYEKRYVETKVSQRGSGENILQLIAWEIDDNVPHPNERTGDRNSGVAVASIMSIDSPSELTTTTTKDSSHSAQNALIARIKPKQYYNYLMLDSDNCHLINESRDRFTWLIQEEKVILQRGLINVHSGFRNIVAARLGRFTMNHMNIAFTDDAVARNRYGIGFDEFASQALITPDGNKFQFMVCMLESDNAYGTNITLSPFNNNRGWFRFREPFTTLSSLTLNMYNLNTNTRVSLPDSYVSFGAIKHSGNVYITSESEIYNNTITMDNGGYLPINYNYVGGYKNTVYDALLGEQVLFSGIDTGDPVLDALYNGQIKSIKYIDVDEFIVIGESGTPIFPVGDYSMTITLLYKPRFICALELISEYDDEPLDAAF